MPSSSCRVVILTALMLAAGGPADARQASETETLAELRREIAELRSQVRALQEQMAVLSAGQSQGAPAAPAGSPSTPAASGSAATAAVPPDSAAPDAAGAAPQPSGSPSGVTRAGSSIFNPAISAVFQFIGSDSLSHDADDDGFSLSEAEIALQSAVDPYARVDLFLAFTAEGEAEVEEGTVTATALPGGLQLKGGRFKSTLGKWNRWHPHQFHTVDAPDVLGALFGEESLTADGVSVSWLVPGTRSVFLESTTEVGNTSNEVTFNAEGADPMLLQHLGSVFTLTANATLGLGVTAAAGRAGATGPLLAALEEAGLAGILEPDTDLRSRVLGADLTYKWKPLSRNTYRSALLQAEAIASRRDIEVLDGTTLRRVTSDIWGGYAYGEYQFAKRWRGGVRYDRTEFPGLEGASQRALSAVLRIAPTEFQQFRIQFKRTSRSREAATLFFDDEQDDHQVFIEWIPAIGAHAAHPY
jgi:hypothetical protein